MEGPKRLKLFEDEKKGSEPGHNEVLYHGYCVVEREGERVLFSRWQGPQRSKKIMIPKSFIQVVLRHFHGLPVHGHQGVTRTIGNIRSSFRWKGLYKDVRAFLAACRVCAGRKPPQPARQGMTKPIVALRPFQVLFSTGWDQHFTSPRKRTGTSS
jgi:hypothetical protein